MRSSSIENTIQPDNHSELSHHFIEIKNRSSPLIEKKRHFHRKLMKKYQDQ